MDIEGTDFEELNDPEVLEALSSVGVFITNYKTGKTLNSNTWKSIPDKFTVTSNRDFLNYIHEDDRERIRNSIDDIYSGKSENFKETYRIETEHGEYKWVYSFGKTTKFDPDGKPIIFVGLDMDITNIKETEIKLLESIQEERHRRLELETLRDIVKVISSSLDVKETIKEILFQISRLIPYETATIQLLEGDFLHVIGAEGFTDNSEILKMKFLYPQPDGSLSTHVLQNNTAFLTNNVPRDFPLFTQPDSIRQIVSWIGIPLTSHDRIIGLLALDGYSKNHFNKHHLELCKVIGDHISIALDNAFLHEKAYKLAMEDSLTGVGSRHRISFEGRLLFETAKRSKSSIAVCVFDADFFKSINDDYGHDTGDTVLKHIAESGLDELRVTDIIGRYGGDEFIIIMPNTDGDKAYKVVERIRKKLCTYVYDGIDRCVTISCGIAYGVPQQNEKLINYIKLADSALYISKSKGRNSITIHQFS